MNAHSVQFSQPGPFHCVTSKKYMAQNIGFQKGHVKIDQFFRLFWSTMNTPSAYYSKVYPAGAILANGRGGCETTL